MAKFEDIVKDALDKSYFMAGVQPRHKDVSVWELIEGWTLKEINDKCEAEGVNPDNVTFTDSSGGNGPLMKYTKRVAFTAEEIAKNFFRKFDALAPVKVHDALTRAGYTPVDGWEHMKVERDGLSLSNMYTGDHINWIVDEFRKIYKKEKRP